MVSQERDYSNYAVYVIICLHSMCVWTGKGERFMEYPKLQELIRLKVSARWLGSRVSLWLEAVQRSRVKGKGIAAVWGARVIYVRMWLKISAR